MNWRNWKRLSIPLWSDFIQVERFWVGVDWRNFQSHYGLILSWKDLNSCEVKCMYFQSHYGLILSQEAHRRTGCLGSLSIPLWSDFIEVLLSNTRIKDDDFQSHYGLILSWLSLDPWWCRCCTFQSHYGLILSLVEHVELPFELPFNPTMVWFYPTLPEFWRILRECFQSHYGLILSTGPSIDTPKPLFAFNPTMVWFYRIRHHRARPRACSLPFNPTMVWFYPLWGFSLDFRLSVAFNPTMVWFYRWWKWKSGW